MVRSTVEVIPAAERELKALSDDLQARFLHVAGMVEELSQAELAERMNTSQPFVARLESGRTLPSMRTLLRIADATGTVPEFHLRPRHDDHRPVA
jgi:ribosome-binding protein aMBF1 (putative translation factor)